MSNSFLLISHSFPAVCSECSDFGRVGQTICYYLEQFPRPHQARRCYCRRCFSQPWNQDVFTPVFEKNDLTPDDLERLKGEVGKPSPAKLRETVFDLPPLMIIPRGQSDIEPLPEAC